MRHVGFAHRPLEEALKVGPGEVEFDGDRFVFDQRSNSAEEIETFVEGRTYCRAVRLAWNNRHFCIGEELARDARGRARLRCANRTPGCQAEQWSASSRFQTVIEELPSS